MNRPPDSPGQGCAGESRRLFFALWPDARLREQLAERIRPLVASVPGRPQRADQWHVTLEFLGAVPEARVSAVREAASDVRARPFELVLDTVEHWRRPAVLSLIPRDCPPELHALVAALRRSLEARGFDPERRTYRPHLTLARRVGAPPDVPAPNPVSWPASEFVLVQSTSGRQGSIYEPLAAWPLVA